MSFNNKYDDSNRFWTEQALNQFGATSNFFFFISLGLFAFLFDRHDIKSTFLIDFGLELNLSKLFLAFTILASFISLTASGLVVLSRLHDLRLTRHTIWVRLRSFAQHGHEFEDSYIDIKRYTLLNQLNNFWSTLRKREYFITDNDLSSPNIRDQKFLELRIRNLLLSRLSWTMVGLQFTALGLSILFYILCVFT